MACSPWFGAGYVQATQECTSTDRNGVYPEELKKAFPRAGIVSRLMVYYGFFPPERLTPHKLAPYGGKESELYPPKWARAFCSFFMYLDAADD
jgi:hypothetical protein